MSKDIGETKAELLKAQLKQQRIQIKMLKGRQRGEKRQHLIQNFRRAMEGLAIRPVDKEKNIDFLTGKTASRTFFGRLKKP